MRDMSHGKNSNVSGERFRRTTTESRNPELCETVRPCWPVSCDADVVDVSLAYDIPVTGMTCCGTAAFADFWIMANRVALASVVLPLMKLSAERSFAWFNPQLSKLPCWPTKSVSGKRTMCWRPLNAIDKPHP